MTKKRNRAPKRTSASVDDFVTPLVGKFIADILNAPRKDPWPEQVRRLRIGAAGGIFFYFFKSLFNEGVAGVMELITVEPGERWGELIMGGVVGAVLGMAAGAVVAWISAQRSGGLLFVLGMLGITLLVSLLPGLNKRVGWIVEPFTVTRVYAQSEEKCVGDTAFQKGFKAILGVRERYNKYAVVVASGISRADAQSKMKTINAEDPSLKLRVGPRACDNDFYPVFASDYLPYNEAKAALEKARKLKTAPDAYLSPGPRE